MVLALTGTTRDTSPQKGFRLGEKLTSVVVTVRQADGWHARPATDFARIVSDSGLAITVSRAGEEPVRGDSVLSLLTIGARFGEELTITVSEEQAEAANATQTLQQLTQLF